MCIRDSVVALARVALGVLVGEDRTGGGHDRQGGEVFRGDELEGRVLALYLAPDDGLELRILGQGVGGSHPWEGTLAAVPLDPRTPVIVGVGQLTRRPPGPATPEWVRDADEPADMMAEALRRAGRDSGSQADLLARADRIAVVALMSWAYRNPALILAERLGASPSDLVMTGTGGN